MACAGENYPYPRQKKAMEDDVLTIDDIANHVTRHGAYNGVRIREFDDGNVNPQPVKRDEEEESADHLWEEFLSPNKLKSLTGVSNLNDVTFLEMQVNTNDHSLGNFGGLLPNLTQLKLSNSVISTVRDLGTSLTSLRTLWMCQCGLTDLDGISSVSSLVELYVAFNDISDVSPVSMLDSLEVLDLEGNLIDDLSQVEFLTLCSSLKSLNLEGNPVCVAPHPTSSAEDMAEYEYRRAIHQAVPGIKVLDDEPLLIEKIGGKPVLRDMPDSAKNIKVPNHLKEEWKLINDGLKVMGNEQDEEQSNSRPSSEKGTTRPKTALARQRPASAARQRPSSAARQRPGSAFGQRPGSALGSSGSQSELTGIFQMEDDSSDLTHGSGAVICGNISRALKSRRKNVEKVAVSPFSDEPRIHLPEKSYEEEQPNAPSKKDIFEELKEWRQEFSKLINDDHRLPSTSFDSESSQSESESPFSSPRRTEAFETSPSSSTSHSRPSMSPTPPPPSQAKHTSPMTRSLPSAPLVGRDLNRPHTSGEFRMRRYRQPSTEQAVDNLRSSKDSNKVDSNHNQPSLDDRIPSASVLDNEPRSSSAPVRAMRRYRVLPNTPGTPPDSQSDTTSEPSSQSPVSSLSHGVRPGTAAAALQKRRLKSNKL